MRWDESVNIDDLYAFVGGNGVEYHFRLGEKPRARIVIGCQSTTIVPGTWIVKDGNETYFLTPGQFSERYELDLLSGSRTPIYELEVEPAWLKMAKL